MNSKEMTASNYPLHAWGGSPVLNEAFALYYKKDPTFLNLSQVVTELKAEFTGTCEQAPTVELGPLSTEEVVRMYNQANAFSPDHAGYAKVENVGETPPNISLTMEEMRISIYDYEGGVRGKLLAEDTFKIVSYGVFAIQDSKLVLTSLTSKVSGGTGGDKPLVQKIVNSYVIPGITKRVAGITLPQFQNLFGTGLDASIANVDVINQQFNLYASISPSVYVTSSGVEGNTTEAAAVVNAYASGEAVQLLAKTLMKPISSNFDKESGGSFGGAGIKGTIHMGQPTISINGSSATASAPISISAKGGVKAFWNWVWIPLPVPDTNVTIKISLSNNGTDAYIEVTGIDSIHVSLGDWPSVLKPVESAIESLLDGIVSLFQETISHAVSGIKIDLFSLPNEIPGMRVPATLTFTGLEFANSGVQTGINLSNP